MTSAAPPAEFVLAEFSYHKFYFNSTPPKDCFTSLEVEFKAGETLKLSVEVSPWCYETHAGKPNATPWVATARSGWHWCYETYAGEPDATCADELARLVLEHEPWKWPRDRDSYSWNLRLCFAEQICAEGDAPMWACERHWDEKERSAAYLAFERALTAYALPKLMALRAARPRHITLLKFSILAPEERRD